MANLTFTKQADNSYAAEFTATGDFNLHMESVTEIKAVVYMKTVSEGKYAVAAAFNHVGNVLDSDFSALVYPKTIKVVSQYETSNNKVTFA